MDYCEYFKNLATVHLNKLFVEIRAYEKIIAEKEAEVQTNSRTIFEISGVSENALEGFDMEGDEDILKISFRGEKVDIQRSMLTRSALEWNLFSCLFKKQWDEFHVRDKEGRIYLDFKYDGFRELIDNFRTDHEFKTASIHYNQHVERGRLAFKLRHLFERPEHWITGIWSSSTIVPKSLATAQLGKSPFSMCFNTLCGIHCKLLHSFDFSTDLDQLVPEHDLRYKSFFLLAKVKNGPTMGIINDSHIYSTRSGTRTEFKVFRFPTTEEIVYLQCRLSEANDLTSLLPMLLVNSQNNPLFEIQKDCTGRYCKNPNSKKIIASACKFEKLEIFEMLRRYRPQNLQLLASNRSICGSAAHSEHGSSDEMEVDQTEETENSKSEGRANGVSDPLPTLEKCRSLFDLPTLQFQQKLNLIKEEQYNQFKEIHFLTKYFYWQWFEHAIVMNDNFDLTECCELLKCIYNKKTNRSTPFPIISFNVEGEIISVLRSTLLRVVPESLLTIKISGRWIIQKNEMDEHGNLIVDHCSKRLFDQIITCLANSDSILYITEETKNECEEVLDYLQINHFDRYYIYEEPSSSQYEEEM
jgi:hypothetical protein